jgi:hypothetical protein
MLEAQCLHARAIMHDCGQPVNTEQARPLVLLDLLCSHKVRERFSGRFPTMTPACHSSRSQVPLLEME